MEEKWNEGKVKEKWNEGSGRKVEGKWKGRWRKEGKEMEGMLEGGKGGGVKWKGKWRKQEIRRREAKECDDGGNGGMLERREGCWREGRDNGGDGRDAGEKEGMLERKEGWKKWRLHSILLWRLHSSG